MPDPLFKYIGAKQNLAPSIIGNMPRHKTYIEVFGGGLSVFWSKPKADWNIINDINKNIINLYEVVQNEKTKKELVYNLIMTPYSRYVFDTFSELYFNREEYDKLPNVKRALVYLYLIKTCFNGNINTKSISTGVRYTTNWGMKNINPIEEAFKFLNSDYQGKYPVFVENLHYADLLDKYVIKAKPEYMKDTFVYLDPPYWVTAKQNYYEFNFTEEEHIKLANKLRQAECNWMVSYDDVPEIREIYKDYHIQLTKPLAQTASNSDEKIIKRELLITNYDISTANGLFGGEYND